MRSFLSSVSFLFLGLSALASAKSSSGDDVLVILDPKLNKADYSTFFGGLELNGYTLTFRSPKDVEPKIIRDDVPSYSHVILFTPETKGYASDITPQSIVHLLSGNTNLLIAASPKQTLLTSLAAEFSLIPPPPGANLISHFPPRSEPASVIPISIPDYDPTKPAFKGGPLLTPHTKPVWYSGTAWALGNNPLLFPILNAPMDAFVSDATGDDGADALVEAVEKGGEGLWAGSSLAVAAGFQTKEGSRVAWVGGVDVFSDEFANKEVEPGVQSGNRRFARDVAAWAFQENLVLRIDSTTHHLVNQTEPQAHYTTNDLITFTAQISKFDPVQAKWTPHVSLKDLQFEFTMLDPHIRTALAPVAGNPGAYSVTFRAPDRHGVFKFVVDYKRKGWTGLFSSTTVPVVPPRHDGYPRFLSAAWPYYAGAISTSVAFLLFSTAWLAGDVKDGKAKAKKVE